MAQDKRVWDPWKMYDATPEELRAIRDRAKMRESLKAEWTKKFTNPFKSPHDGGFLFDPAIQRYMALRTTRVEYFKGTFRTGSFTFLMLVVPVAYLTYSTMKKKEERERQYRNGEVMYKDRQTKFMY